MNRSRGALLVPLVIVAVAVLLAAIHPPLDFLNGLYAQRFYPAVQQAITGLTNSVPFALGSLWLVLAIVTLVAIWIIALRQARSRHNFLRAALATCAYAATIYIWFLLAWGWNYDRPSFATTLHYRAAGLDRAELNSVEDRLVATLNALAPRAHRAHERAREDIGALRAAAQRARELLGIDHRVITTNPKHWILDAYFNAVGISGMFFPFTFETYLASDLLWFEYPFTLEHEWSHVAGIARESDANFSAALATLESDDPVLRYSGLLMVYAAMPRGPSDRRLSALVLADYGEIRARDRRHINRPAARLAWSSYGEYLKSQHVENGVINYADYVGLLLETKTGRDALARVTSSTAR